VKALTSCSIYSSKFSSLSKSFQSKIKTTTLHTIIIKKESSEDIKFEIFERLNTGSIKLNEDEIRNTIYRGEYISLLAELENNETFSKMVNRGGANGTDKTHVKEYSSINLRFWHLNITLRNSHFIRDFQFQNYYQKQSIKTTLTYPLLYLFLNIISLT